MKEGFIHMKLSKSMTSGAPLGQIVGFAVPIALGSLLQLVYSIVDSAVVGRLIGVEAFAAVGAAGNMNWMFVSVILGITQGFGTVTAQHFGSGDGEKVRRSFSASLLLSLCVGAVLSVAAVVAVDPVLRMLQTPEAIFADASSYLRVMSGGLVVTFLYNNLGASLRAVGNSRTPFYALVFSSVLNVLLDILLVSLTPWGVAAAALATVLAQGTACFCCFVVVQKIDDFRLIRGKILPDRKMLLSHIRVGGTMGFRNLVTDVVGIITQYYINGYGVDFIAAIAASKKMYGLLELVSCGMEGAVATYVAQNYGARRMDRIRSGLRQSAVVMLVGAGVIMAGMLLCGRTLMGLLISGDTDEVDRVLFYACEQLNLMLAFLPSLYLLYLFRAALQGMGSVTLTMISGLIELVTRLLVVFTMPALIGRWGIYLIEVSSWPTAMLYLCIAFFVVYFRRRREFSDGCCK